MIHEDQGLLEVVHWYPGDNYLEWKINKIKIRREKIDINKEMGDLYRIDYPRDRDAGSKYAVTRLRTSDWV